jgi:hypothetical protein
MDNNSNNCWEFLGCEVYKDCPAYKENMGNRCFAVKGTLCRGEIQGDYREKIEQCRNGCSFYDKLIRE